MPKFKNLAHFSESKQFEKRECVSHPVYLCKKKKNQKKWYLKCLGENFTEALIETIAQEFFRLILPYHPKTRIALASGSRFCYVLSKEIDNFDPNFFLNPQNNERIINDEITGLAATQVLALLLNEIDFKPCNVGVADGKVIKIDGDYCFASLNRKIKYYIEGKNNHITKTDLEALPMLVDYEPSNWLNLIAWSEETKQAEKNLPTAADQIINQMPAFKHELYQTILRIILLPDELIRFFTKSYIPDEVLDSSNRVRNNFAILAETLITRKNQLAQVSYQIPAFNHYRLTNNAHEEILDYLQQLKEFKTLGSSNLLADFKNGSGINIEETIFKNSIKEYSLIKDFLKELNVHQKYCKELHSIRSALPEPVNLQGIAHVIELFEEIKPIFNQYLDSPTIIHLNALRETLDDRKKILDRLPVNHSFIPQISTLRQQLEPVKKSASPIKVPNFSTFFQKRKLSASETHCSNKKFISD